MILFIYVDRCNHAASSYTKSKIESFFQSLIYVCTDIIFYLSLYTLNVYVSIHPVDIRDENSTLCNYSVKLAISKLHYITSKKSSKDAKTNFH